jgi:hypothetical protein
VVRILLFPRFAGGTQLVQFEFGHFQRHRFSLAFQVGVISLLLGVASAGRGQSVHPNQTPVCGDSAEPLDDARESEAATAKLNQATLYIYWMQKLPGYNRMPINVNGEIIDQAFNCNIGVAKEQQGMVVKVPQGVTVVFEPERDFYAYPNYIFVIPECKGLEHELARVWALGGIDEGTRSGHLSEVERTHLSSCEASLRKAVPIVDEELHSDFAGPSEGLLSVCALQGQHFGNAAIYYKSALSECRKDMQDTLNTLAGNGSAGVRITFNAEADKTYYVRLFPYKDFKLMDAAQGAREIGKAHIPMAP